MRYKLPVVSLVVGLVAVASGCSYTGAAFSGVRIGKNLKSKDSHLRIWLDGQEAKQSKLKKAYFGHASFKLKESVSETPTFRFGFIDEDELGRVTGSHMQIYQEFDDDYSHQAEFTVSPRGSGRDAMMQPEADYAFAGLGGEFQVLDFDRNEVGGITLKPDTKYMLVFSVTGDRSETIQVRFDTK
jgi:hypothetical protein